MTLNTNPGRNEYTATAGQTIFNYTFKIYASTDLDVYVTPAGQECSASDLTTAYTVAGVGLEDGGSITLTTPTSVNDLVTIVSSIPTDRTTDYQNNGNFRPTTVNDDFDRTVSLVKQVDDMAQRALLFPACQQNVTSLSLPPPLANTFLQWKPDLTGMQNFTFSSTGIVAEVSVQDYPALRALISSDYTDGQVIFVTNDGIAGDFVVKTGTVTDNGGTLIVFTDDPNRYAERITNGFYNVLWFGAVGDGTTDDTVAIQNTIDFAISDQNSTTVSQAKVICPPNREYRIQGVNVNSGVCPVTITAYGAWFQVYGATGVGFNISNLRHVFMGGTFRQSASTNTNTAIKIFQTASAQNTSYNTIKDVNIINTWKGIDCFMDTVAFPGAATFRHLIHNCHIRNTTNGTKTWSGSRGIVLGGNVIGDSTGNDTHVVDTLVAGYETGIYSNGVRTSLSNAMVDGSAFGITIDGSNATIMDGYIEFNDTGININSTASSTTIIGTSIASDVTNIDDMGQWTQILLCQPSFNQFQQSQITPTGSQTALTVNQGTSSTVPILEVSGTGEFEIAADGAIKSTIGSTGTTYTAGAHDIRSSSAPESGSPIIFFQGSSGTPLQIRPVSGASGNSAAMCLRLGSDNVTSRSINAGGTINASGADYAEYEYNNGLKFEKGDVVGFDDQGRLTNCYSKSVRFAIKSTNPSYVGGDTWGSESITGKEPTQPKVLTIPEDAKEDEREKLKEEHKSLVSSYEKELSKFQDKLESARIKVDRIAYSGKVPLNFTKGQPGEYIVVISGDKDSINMMAVESPTFDQYLTCIGRINKILDDGRAEVAVIIH